MHVRHNIPSAPLSCLLLSSPGNRHPPQSETAAKQSTAAQRREQGAWRQRRGRSGQGGSLLHHPRRSLTMTLVGNRHGGRVKQWRLPGSSRVHRDTTGKTTKERGEQGYKTSELGRYKGSTVAANLQLEYALDHPQSCSSFDQDVKTQRRFHRVSTPVWR